MSAPIVGDRVRIERDEKVYPPRGTWWQLRGKTGTVVEVNTDRKRPHLTEYGVVFRKAPPGPWRKWWSGGEITWFKLHELTVTSTPTASQRVVGNAYTIPEGDSAREALVHA